MEKLGNRICLDTNVIIDILRGDQETVNKINELERSNMLATTFINLFELYSGVFLSSKKEENFNKIENFLPKLILINLSHLSTLIGGQIKANLKTRGQIVESRDLLIASITIAEGFALLTKNKKHFENIPGLKLYD